MLIMKLIKKTNKTYARQTTITSLRRKRFRWTVVGTFILIMCVYANVNVMWIIFKDSLEPEIVEAKIELTEEELSVKEYIFETVKTELGLDVAIDAINVVNCESRFNPNAIGMNRSSVDLGVWQWNNVYHPEVTPQCAFDYRCATEKAIELYKIDNSFRQWACSK